MWLVNIKHYFFYQIARHIPTNDLRLKALCNMECVVKEMANLLEKNGFEIVKKKGIFFPIALFVPFVIVFAKKVKEI